MTENRARRQGFTLIELLVVIAIISIIAGFLVPTLLRGRGEAYKLQCSNNLRQLFTFAMQYSDKKGTRAFPVGTGKNPRAHESLNEMISYDSEGLQPKLFVCPEGNATDAQVDEKMLFVLDETSLDYAWVARRTKNTATNQALSSDKYVDQFEDGDGIHSGHKKGLNVLMTDNSVGFKAESELPQEEDPTTGMAKLPKGLMR